MVPWRMTLRILIALFCVLNIAPVAGLAQVGTVEFSPEISYVIPGQPFDVDIQLDAAGADLHCYLLTLNFDRSLLELIAVTEGPLLQTQGETFFFDVDTAGSYDIGSCLLGDGLDVDGPGVLATLSFQAKLTVGSAPLDLEITDFSDAFQTPLAAMAVDGLVVIQPDCCQGRVGDANNSGEDEPTIGDISTLVDAKFITSTCVGIVPCITEGDINQSGGPYATCDDITISDISTLVDYLFIAGPTVATLEDCF